jgi:flagellar biosynthesis GTPase FlhF
VEVAVKYEGYIRREEAEVARQAKLEEERRAEEARVRAQLEEQLRAEAKERERLAEAARAAIEEQHRLEAEKLRQERAKLEEERKRDEERRRKEEEARVEAARRAEAEKLRRAEPEAAEAEPEYVDNNYTYVSKTVRLIFRRSVDPNITARIHEIIKATLEYYGKEKVYMRIKATVPDTSTVCLEFVKIPLEEMELLSNIIKVIGNSGLGIAKAILE